MKSMDETPLGDPPQAKDHQPIRVFLLDDHELVRIGLMAMIDAEPDLKVVGQASSATEALEQIETTQPTVAVLDIRLADGNGIEVCREIRSAHPDVRCLILTSFDSDQAVVDSAMAGAVGFAVKQLSGPSIIETIRRVGEGETLLDQGTIRMAIRRISESEVGALNRLTPQETRIFDLIGEGCTNRQIAEEMFLAEKTVKNYVSNVLAKLGMGRRTEAAALAARVDERRRSES